MLCNSLLFPLTHQKFSITYRNSLIQSVESSFFELFIIIHGQMGRGGGGRLDHSTGQKIDHFGLSHRAKKMDLKVLLTEG